MVEFLKKPERFTAVGARIPKGVLLVAPQVPRHGFAGPLCLAVLFSREEGRGGWTDMI